MKYEYIRSMRLAGYLMLNGFKIYAVQKDIKNPAFDVYVFKKSGELNAAMKEYSSESGGKENGNNYKRSRNKNCSN